MKNTILAITFFIFGWSAPLSAEVMTYQGRLKESNVPVNANRVFSFKFCDAESFGNCDTTPSGFQSFTVQNGLFKSTFTIPASNLTQGEWYLQVSVGVDAPSIQDLSPRERLTAVPYSVYSATAGYSPAALQKAGDTMTGQLTSISSVTITGNGGVYGLQVSSNVSLAGALYSANGNVGIGTAAPQYPLVVLGNPAGNIINAGDAANPWGATAGFGLDDFNTYPGAALYVNNAKVFNVESNGGAILGSTYMTADAVRNGLIVQGHVGIGTALPNYALEISSGGGEAGTIMSVSTGATNLFWVAGDGAHSLKFTGDGSGLTGVTGAAGTDSSKLPLTGGTLAGQLTLAGSTLTVTGDAFSVGGSTFVVINGKVGIGTTNPQAKLDVDGGHAIFENDGSDINLYLKTKTAGAYLGNLFFLNYAGTGYGGVSADQTNGRVNIWTGTVPGGNEKVTISSNGNVGIGTTGPNYRMHVSSGAGETGIIMAVSTGATNIFTVDGSGVNALRFTGDGSGLTGVTGASGTDSSKLPLTGGTLAGQLTLSGSTLTVTGDAFSVGGSTLVVTNGYVGLGTNAPAARLDVVSDNGYLHFRSPNTSLIMNMIPQTYAPAILNNNGDGPLGFSIANNVQMWIDRQTLVGIGTQTPAYRLHVSSAAGEAGIIMAVSTGITNVFWVDGSGANALKFTGDGSGLTGVTAAGAVLKSGDTMTGDLMMTGASTITVAGSGFSVGGSTFAVTYGRVGIGTAAPGRALDVQLPAGVNDDGIRVTARSGIRLDLYSNQADVNARNWSLLSNNPRFGDFSVRRSNSMGGDPNLNGTTAMYLAREGNIGFSNDLPLYRLHVSSGAGEAGIVMAVSTGTSNIFWVAGDGAYATRFVGDGSGLTGVTGASGTDSTRVLKTGDTMTGQLTNTSSVTITGNGGGAYGLEVSSNISLAGALYSSNGNVGIGTLNPQYGLDIGNGTNGISQTMRIKVGSGGSDKASLLLSGPVYAGSIVYDAGNAGNITIANSFNGADPFGNILFQTNGSTERLRITRAGNVGVGATAPDQKLTVAGNISQTGVLISSGAGDNYFAGNVGIGTAGQGAKLHVVGGGGTLIDIDNPDGTIGGQLMVRGQANPNRQLWLGYDTTNNYGLVQAYEQTMSAKPLVLQPNSGNVGIGATAPDQKLTVAGNISQTGVLISSGAGSNYFAGDVTAARYQIGGSTVLALLPGIGSMAVGPMAGAVSAGAYNLFIGSAAGKVNSSGLHNVLVGYGAGQNNLTGTGNTFIGSSAGSANSTGLQNIVIGYNQQTSASDSASELNIGGVLFGRLGEKAIGISTRAPQAALDVVSTGTAANVYAQIWRDGGGNVVSSVSSQGVFYGDGSALTGVSGSDVTKLPLGGGTLTGQLTLAGSSLTVSGGVAGQNFFANGRILFSSDGVKSTDNLNPASSITIAAGYAPGTGAPLPGGHLTLKSGHGNGSGFPIDAGYGGDVRILALGGNNSRGGDVWVRSGNTDSYASAGQKSVIDLWAGASDNTFAGSTTGGRILIEGHIYPDGGGSGGTYVRGGHVTITGGNGTTGTGGSGTGGNIVLKPGTGPGGLGNVGISTGVPQARLDVLAGGSAQTDMAQLWRNSAGTIVSSVSATGVLMAGKFIGDGSGLTGVSASDASKLPLAGGTMAGDITMGGNDLYAVSTITATGDITAARYQIAGSTVLAILPGTGSLGVGVSAGRVNVGTSNSFLGYQAGYSNTTGSNNSFLGYNAGAADSTGGENSFLGSYTGFNNTTGGSNSFLGTFVGYSNTTGFNNSFLGTYAGYSNTTGSNNSFLGTYAGYNTKAGSANAVFGTDAGKGVLNNSFSSATIMGYQAGFGLTTGSDNIFLGFQTGYNVTTGTGNILIGYGKDTSAPGANNELNIGGVLYGDLSAKTIGISRKAPEAALDIVSTGTVQTQFAQIWRDSAGVIKSSMSATGVLMAGKFIGDGSGLNGVAATDATKLPIAGGFMSGQLTNTSSVTITGNGGAYGLQVSSNVSLAGALYSANGNIGIGTTTPQGLLHVGAGATPGLLVDSAGYLGIGTVNPSYSLHVVKTAGNIAGYFQSSDSTGSGIYLAATGALGRSYGLFSTASGLLGGGKFTIYDPGAAAYRLTIDAVGYVGIGTTAPDQKLTVAGNISQTGVLISSGTGNNYFAGNVGIAAPSPAGLFQVGGGSLTVLAGGNVGVGTTAPQSHLHVDDALNATLAGAANLALLVRHNTITAGGGPGIGFSSDNTASVGAKIVHLRTGSNSQGDLAFYTKTSNGVPESQKMIIKDSGNVGISTGAPEARLDVLAGGSAQTDMAQLWRNSAGAIVSSVSATGVMMASKFIGDGSGLAGISANDVTKLPLNGGVLNGWLEVGNNSTMTVTGNAFSVGGSTLVVAAGHVGINWSTPDAPLVVNAMSGETYIAKLGTSGINISIGGAIQTTGTGHGAISGNPRGIGAVDLQTKRTNATYVASGDYSALLGGYDNRATGNNSAVLSGFFNAASGVSAAVLTGISNTASNSYAAVGGGRDNTASGTSSFIGGGGRDGSGYPPQGNTASQAFAAIAGGAFNVVSGSNSFIGAGAYNVVTGTSAVTAGGEGNKASGMWSAIGGGRVNNASGIYSAVSGGTNNTASGGYSAVAGGNANVATGLLAAVSGGDSNTASGQYSAVAGGMNNISSGEMSVVSGGRYNESAGHNSFIGGGGVDAGGYGGANKAQGDWSGIVAGIFNVVSGSSSFVGGGAYNVAAGTSSVIAGGDNNRTENFFSSVGGGKSNTARDLYATVGGGSTNNANNSLATIGGGGFHTIDAPYGTVAGGNNNKIQSFATAGFIGGGENNISTGAYSAIGGGRVNSSSGAYSAVLGGYGNAAEGAYSAVAGGNTNRAYGANSAVSGGKLNSALGDFSAIAGGDNNSANAPDSIVAGGNFNLAGGQLSAVAGGNYNAALGMASFIGGGGSNKTGLTAWGAVAFGANNAAMGQYSFAAGRTSTSAYDGSFTWADSQGIDVVNNIPDQVMFKAKGGFWVSTGTVYTNPALYIDAGNNIGIGTAFPTAKLHLANAGDGIRFPDGTLMTTAGVGSASNLANITDALINGDSDSNLTGSVRLQTSGLDRLYVSTNGNVGIGTTLPSALLDVNGTARLGQYVVESRDAGGTMSAADFGKTITVYSGSPQAIMLPVGAAGSVGAQFTFVKLGAGTVTITAGATDYIADSSMAGSIYNALAAETYATITLRLTTSTRWSIVGGNGSWTTN